MMYRVQFKDVDLCKHEPTAAVCVCVVVNADPLTFSIHDINSVYIVKAES